MIRDNHDRAVDRNVLAIRIGDAVAQLETLESEPERTARLKENGRYFVEKAREAGLDTGLSEGYSVVPVIVGDSLRAAQLSNDLFAEGINVMPIIHPAS